MRIVRDVAALREARAVLAGPVGFVPTMGFLHDGHLSLVRTARADCASVVSSLFVNPLQFGRGEDLDRYPRAFERDAGLLEAEGVDVLFAPDAAAMYPQGFASAIDVGPVAQRFEGALRPGHFAGVATVVAKLFHLVQPGRAYFGRKDAQQCAVIRRMVRDLDMPVAIVIGETVREANGLAMSSRNAYLRDDERAAAGAIWRGLRGAADAFSGGERAPEALAACVGRAVAGMDGAVVEYAAVVGADDFVEAAAARAGDLLVVAVRFGGVRLLDNVLLS